MSVKQPEEMAYGEKRAKYLAEIADACKDLAAIVEKSLDENMMPVVLGGDHSIAAGPMLGVAGHLSEKGKKSGFIWLGAARGAHIAEHLALRDPPRVAHAGES